MAHSGLATSSSLAIARVVIASYCPCLRTSERSVLEQLVMQIRKVMSEVDTIAADGSDADVCAATAAPWLYVILLFGSSEPP